MIRIEVALSIILFSVGVLALSSVLFDINCKVNPSAELYRALGNPISSKKFKKNVFFTVILFVASIVLSNNIWGTIEGVAQIFTLYFFILFVKYILGYPSLESVFQILCGLLFCAGIAILISKMSLITCDECRMCLDIAAKVWIVLLSIYLVVALLSTFRTWHNLFNDSIDYSLALILDICLIALTVIRL